MTERLLKNLISEELFGKRVCESLDEQFIVNGVYEEVLNEKILMHEPVTIPELRDILKKKVLNFEFIKLDGEVRPAKGTTMQKYIPQEDHPKGIKPSSDKVAVFFDLSKNAWRSVSNKSKEITVEEDPETKQPKVVVSDKTRKEEPKVKEPVSKPEPTPEPMKVPEPTPAPVPEPKTAPVPEPVKAPLPPPATKPEEPEEVPEPIEKPLDIADDTKPAEEIEDDEIKATGDTIEEPEEEPEEPKEDEEEEDEKDFEYKPIEDFEYRPVDKLPNSKNK
jgi:hypothetical protein